MAFRIDFIQHKLDAAIEGKTHKTMNQPSEEQTRSEIKHKNRNPSKTTNNTDNIFWAEEFPPLTGTKSNEPYLRASTNTDRAVSTGEERNAELQHQTRSSQRHRQPSKTLDQQHRQSPKTLVGTGAKEDDLQAVAKTAWLFVGRQKKGTPSEKVKNLTSNGIQGNITCEELTTMGEAKAFKVGISFEYLEMTYNPEFWPRGVTVRWFCFPRRRNELRYLK